VEEEKKAAKKAAMGSKTRYVLLIYLGVYLGSVAKGKRQGTSAKDGGDGG